MTQLPLLNLHPAFEQHQNLFDRRKVIHKTAQALVSRLRIQEDMLIAIRLTPTPYKRVLEAVEAFVRDQACAMSNKDIPQCFDMLAQRLSERISDLYDYF